VKADGQVTVRDKPQQHRFEVLVDGEVAGFSAYRREGDAFAFTHTEVDDAFEGQGLGSQLVGAALNELRRRGVAVLPYCPFVRMYLEKHPELHDLVPAEERERPPMGSP